MALPFSESKTYDETPPFVLEMDGMAATGMVLFCTGKSVLKLVNLVVVEVVEALEKNQFLRLAVGVLLSPSLTEDEAPLVRGSRSPRLL